VAAELPVDFGVVVVVVGVVVAVVVGVVAADEADELVATEDPAEDWPDTVAADLLVVDGVVDVVGEATDEWAEPPDATRTPRPTAAAEAATPMPTVARRTRVMARSRARAAERGVDSGWGSCGSMADLSG
jgi:pyruvate/2-oxoglutarate dehydrogenase complex dihydrolipoamide acyltransferase (E2) component